MTPTLSMPVTLTSVWVLPSASRSTHQRSSRSSEATQGSSAYNTQQKYTSQSASCNLRPVMSWKLMPVAVAPGPCRLLPQLHELGAPRHDVARPTAHTSLGLSSTQAFSASAASTCFLKSLLKRLVFNPAAHT